MHSTCAYWKQVKVNKFVDKLTNRFWYTRSHFKAKEKYYTSYLKILFHKLDKKINKCLDYIGNLANDDKIECKRSLYRLENTCKISNLTYFYKIINNICGFESNIFERVYSNYNSRSQLNKHCKLPNYTKFCTQRTFFYSIVKVYNALTIPIKNADSISIFKKLLGNFVYQKWLFCLFLKSLFFAICCYCVLFFVFLALQNCLRLLLGIFFMNIWPTTTFLTFYWSFEKIWCFPTVL